MLQHIPYSALAVIIPTFNRPESLGRCLEQFTVAREYFKDVYAIVVDESDNDDSQKIISDFSVAVTVRQKAGGLCGAYGKDTGIRIANSKYVCFWDDDNIYYPNSLKSLYAAAKGHDVGIVQTMLPRIGKIIPKWRGEFKHGDIDTMCFCVRHSVAAKELWSKHQKRGTDFDWISRISKHTVDINFLNEVIGEHTCNRFQRTVKC